jgi:hypothetical protein
MFQELVEQVKREHKQHVIFLDFLMVKAEQLWLKNRVHQWRVQHLR